jgi:GNAT superfamily N-acetyltransferase
VSHAGATEVEVTITSLEILPDRLRPARPPQLEVAVLPVDLPSPAFNRYLYTAVGGELHWVDRLGWTYERWMAWLARDEAETWVAYHHGTPLGYVELELQEGPAVEIAYFGVLPAHRRRGVGGHLLTHAVARGFAMGADRVWVHTCTLDGPDALPTYLGRGFTAFDERTATQRLHPDPGPWPGARSGQHGGRTTV